MALIHVIRSVGALSIPLFLVATVLLHEPLMLVGAAAVLGITVLTAGVHLAEAGKIKCPVCTVPLFARSGCNKHRTAVRLLGSYRLRIAMEVLTGRLFHCHHCGEKVVCRREAGEGAPGAPGRRVVSHREVRRRRSSTGARGTRGGAVSRSRSSVGRSRSRSTSEEPTLPS